MPLTQETNLTYRPKKIKWPHKVDHDKKEVKVYIASGWPTVMAAPIVVEEAFPGYKAVLVSKDPNE